jgi:Sulfate permease and related transporters (MFS superfamily)
MQVVLVTRVILVTSPPTVGVSGRQLPTVRFDLREASGALGDAVTVVPIILAVGLTAGFDLGIMLLWFAIFQGICGVVYGVPISVEPMKALAGLAIAGTLVHADVVLAGVLLGLLLTGAGWSGQLSRIAHLVDGAVVRGIQLGVGLILLELAVGISLADLPMTVVGILVAGLLVALRRRRLAPVALLLIGLPFALPVPLSLTMPTPTLAVPSAVAPAAVLGAVMGQAAMTLGNATLATAVLLGEYFDRTVSEDKLGLSMGLMNLIAVPLGGFPMCHGSGGLAGKYTFGARTAGANLLLAVGYLLMALGAIALLQAFPMSLLGVLLVLIAAELGWTALGPVDDRWVVILVGLVSVIVDLGVALIIGLIAIHLRRILH